MKKVILFLLVSLATLALAHTLIGIWIEDKFEKLINGDPDRKYDITLADIDLNYTFDGLSAESLNIVPTENSDGAGSIQGKVESITIDGLKWTKLLLNNELELALLRFTSPDFELVLGKDSDEKPKSGRSFQNMFADILSRIHLVDFQLNNGSVKLIRSDSSGQTNLLMVDQFSLNAFGVQTDSVQLNHLIPFQLESLKSEVTGIEYRMDEFTILNIDKIIYETDSNSLKITDISVGLTDNRRTISQEIGYQKDIIELDVQSIELYRLKAQSSFYDSLDIEASWIKIDSATMRDFRNKNIPRPEEPEKPMFAGLVNRIPFPVVVDSITISRSRIQYDELGAGQSTPGTLIFENITGSITGISNQVSPQKRFGAMKMQLTAQPYGQSLLDFHVDVPYEGERFKLEAGLSQIDLAAFNPMLLPLTGLEIQKGNLRRFYLNMDAAKYVSRNQFRFDYSGLKVDLMTETKKTEFSDLGFLSGLANTAVSTDNIPGNSGYKNTLRYVTDRDLQRSPFNFMWLSIRDGLELIVPSDVASLFIKTDQKK